MTSPQDTQIQAAAGPPRTSWLQLGVVSAGSFIMWVGFGAIIPYLPIFLQEQAHSSLLMIGVIASMFYVGTLLFSSPLGWLSDIIGRRPVMIAGAILYTIALLLFTTTTNPYWFILFRLLEGIGTAAFGPAAQAFVADITTEENRSKAYGFLTTAQFGGLILGPAAAPWLYQLAGGHESGFFAIFYFGAALSALCLVAIVVFIKEPVALGGRRAARRLERQEAEQEAARTAATGAPGLGRRRRQKFADWRKTVLTPAIIAFVIVAFTSHFAMGAFDVVWSLWLEHLGASMAYIGWTWVAFSVPMLLSFAGGMLADKYSRYWLFVVGYTLSGIAWIFYGITTNMTMFIIVNIVEGFAIAFSYPAKQSFLIQVSPPRWIGSVTGVESTSMQVAGWLGSLIAPPLYGWISGYVLAVCGVVTLTGLAVGATILYGTWVKLKASGPMLSQAELERIGNEVRPAVAAEPPHGVE